LAKAWNLCNAPAVSWPTATAGFPTAQLLTKLGFKKRRAGELDTTHFPSGPELDNRDIHVVKG